MPCTMLSLRFSWMPAYYLGYPHIQPVAAIATSLFSHPYMYKASVIFLCFASNNIAESIHGNSLLSLKSLTYIMHLLFMYSKGVDTRCFSDNSFWNFAYGICCHAVVWLEQDPTF